MHFLGNLVYSPKTMRSEIYPICKWSIRIMYNTRDQKLQPNKIYLKLNALLVWKLRSGNNKSYFVIEAVIRAILRLKLSLKEAATEYRVNSHHLGSNLSGCALTSTAI